MTTTPPDHIQTLGDQIIALSTPNPTAPRLADSIVAVIRHYHDAYETDHEDFFKTLQEDEYNYEEVSDQLIRELLLETSAAYFARNLTEYICETLSEPITVEEVYSHIPEKYFTAETT